MSGNRNISSKRISRTLMPILCMAAAVMTFAFLMATAGIGAATTLNVLAVDKTVPPAPPPAPYPLAGGYRWVLEEDVTFRVEPWNYLPPAVPPADILAVGFHKSYMPVVAQGDDLNTLSSVVLDPDKYYYVSVIPATPGTYSIGGAGFKGSDPSVTVYLNQLPLPTAQITIFVHEDMNPINNVWDEGEAGLEGFRVIVEDAGGRYGISAGEQSQDAFGNPLGTTYLQTCDPYGQNPGSGSYGCLDPDGNPIVEGFEPLLTGPDGSLIIKNMAPGKYGIIIVPPNAVESPPGSGRYVSADWVQTSTIEGTIVIDAWVKANEPPFFAEFGPAGPHTSFGFVPAGPSKPYVDAAALTGGVTISGQIVNLHLSRPPQTAFHNGAPFAHTAPWVGLNQGAAGQGRGVYASRVNDDGTFAIPNVPPGSYQLVVWDDNLDLIFAFYDLTVADGDIALGEVPVFQWFTRMENWVFYDQNENGFRDDGEPGVAEQAVNLRWRDGSLYQSMPTDSEGFVPFDEIFPFFAWLVAEVDFARFKATGLTVTVDDGGAIDPADPWTWEGQLNPQPQRGIPTLNNTLSTTKYRTERGPVLTQGFQGFLGQTSVIEWGKKEYGPGENGGISGIVYYSVTRAEDDPELAAPEPWEPGIPRVTVNLYDATGTTLLNTTTTDSWDDSLPENCQVGSNAGSPTDDPFVFRGVPLDCYDGMRNWNQVRPGVFDGGYAFDAIVDPGTGLEISPIPPGQYVVEVLPPPGYEIVRSQDKNVDFGDSYIPSPLLLPPQCVGSPYIVPAELSLFPGVEAPLAGQELNGCDRKLVTLSDGANAAADFYLFTQVPIAGHIKGFILDDTANEFDPASPQFGEKFAPPWMPVAVRDWTGRMIGSTYSDEYGTYNILVPSTYTNSLPQPSGMSPNMLTACMNDPEADIDPLTSLPRGFFNPQYSTFCYTFQYMPGTTTYLDTPVVPVAAFAGPDQFPLDCELQDHTPRILSVSTSDAQGPYLASDSGTVTINALGTTVPVLNPAYDGLGGVEQKTIPRDFGFGGTAGTVAIIDSAGVAHPLSITSWTETQITGTVAGGTTTGQLVVTRGDNGRSSVNGVTLQVGLRPGASLVTVPTGGSIQAAIEAANPNDLILVAPGEYSEMVIMWKPVQLQGSGEGTLIDAVKAPPDKLVAWRQLLESHMNAGYFDLVPGQQAGFAPGVMAEPFASEEGAGVLVVANAADTSPRFFGTAANQGARIDGFTIRGADTGGGVVVNGYADYLQISNSRIINNNGFFNGGIRVGHPFLVTETVDGVMVHTDSDNDFVRINNNQIVLNGGFDGAGGGISLYDGTDSYEVAENFVCGNFTLGDGAGIGHLGLSDNGLIHGNTILFNENFNQGLTVNGGGISIAGHAPFGCPVDPETGAPDPACLADPVRSLSPGSGSIRVERNRLQGNSAGAGDGGGIRLSRINGQDVAAAPADDSQWHAIEVVNNMIVNNVAGLAGGGMSIQDALRVNILHNTIARNDSTATAGEAFTAGSPSQSNPQPGAGIASRAHSLELSAFLPGGEAAFADPELVNNIVWQNRQFYFRINDTDPANVIYGLCPDIDNIGLGCAADPVFSDLAVLPAGTGTLNPLSSLLTVTTGYDGSNVSGDPLFFADYFNGNRESTITIPETTTAITPTVAFDEGGNFIRLRYGPLTEIRPDTSEPYGDYHVHADSPAVDAGAATAVADDFDGDLRPFNGVADIGADETDAATPPAPAAQAALFDWIPVKQEAGNSGVVIGSMHNSLAGRPPIPEPDFQASDSRSGGGGGRSVNGDGQPASSPVKAGAGTVAAPVSDRLEGRVVAPDTVAGAGLTAGADADASGTENALVGKPVAVDLLPEAMDLSAGEDAGGQQEPASGPAAETSREILTEAAAGGSLESGGPDAAAAPMTDINDKAPAGGEAEQERRGLMSAVPLASLILLALAGLFFFAVLQPRARQKTAQRKRGDEK